MIRPKILPTERRFRINLEIGKHLMLLGNLAIGALVFGQTISGIEFKLEVALTGITVCMILYVTAVYLMKGGEK